MEAAHDAGMEPQVSADPLQRSIGVDDAGVEEDEQIDAAGDDDPEQEVAERA